MRDGAFYDLKAGALDALADLTAQRLDASDLTFAADAEANLPIYDMPQLRDTLADPDQRRALQSEWAWVLGQGPGAVVMKAAYEDLAVIDRVSEAFHQIIAAEKTQSAGKADHFAAAGANDRIWNSLQKLGEADAEAFALYHSNLSLAAMCEAWLGPAYQMTAQVNLVRPGGAAQKAHRDYHLGFMGAAQAAKYPTHAHALSAALTLQGAVAHCDMPVESGPTQLLPYSQTLPGGYLAYHRDDVQAFFGEHAVQLPLAKGDALFFNPALFHAAGQDRSRDIHRMANLFQVSSAFGRAMEEVDRMGLCRRLYPVLQRLLSAGRLTQSAAEAAIAAAAEGYAFPTNLDTDPPVGGLAPESQAGLFRRALAEGFSEVAFSDALTAQAARRRA